MESSTENKILFYERKYYMFSNFSSFTVEHDGIFWMTSEHAYQAAKFNDETLIKEVQNAKSAHDAFVIARSYDDKKRNDWMDIRVETMERIVRAKLQQHKYIQDKLLETGDKEIIENSPVDSFWGWGPNKDGENQLGKIWMRLRAEIK